MTSERVFPNDSCRRAFAILRLCDLGRSVRDWPATVGDDWDGLPRLGPHHRLLIECVRLPHKLNCPRLRLYVVNDSRVYQLDADGSQSTLYTFPFHGALQSFAPFVQGKDGDLYGVNGNGGTNSQGMIFKVGLPSGALTDLVEFNFDNGSYPTAPLIQGTDGNFYGTTRNGAPDGFGTIFRMTPGGDLTTILRFHGTDGSGPQALVQASDGNFYGTTSGGGARNAGTVFRLTPMAFSHHCSHLPAPTGPIHKPD